MLHAARCQLSHRATVCEGDRKPPRAPAGAFCFTRRPAWWAGDRRRAGAGTSSSYASDARQCSPRPSDGAEARLGALFADDGGANSDGDEPLAVGQHPGHVSPAPDTDRGLKTCQSARSRNHRRVALLCVDCARPQALRLSGPVSAGMSYCLDIPTRHTITLDVGRCACHHRPW